jgi:hypothetical protein
MRFCPGPRTRMDSRCNRRAISIQRRFGRLLCLPQSFSTANTPSPIPRLAGKCFTGCRDKIPVRVSNRGSRTKAPETRWRTKARLHVVGFSFLLGPGLYVPGLPCGRLCPRPNYLSSRSGLPPTKSINSTSWPGRETTATQSVLTQVFEWRRGLFRQPRSCHSQTLSEATPLPILSSEPQLEI